MTPALLAVRSPLEALSTVAVVPFAIAVLIISVGLLRTLAFGRLAPAQLAASLALALEFLLAAGLIRLAAVDNFAVLGVVALIIVVRRIIALGVRQSVRGLVGKAPEIRA